VRCFVAALAGQGCPAAEVFAAIEGIHHEALPAALQVITVRFAAGGKTRQTAWRYRRSGMARGKI